jgi:hypothetical protein
MPAKKVNRSRWFEMIGYSLAVLVGIGWGLSSINSGIKEAPKSQRSPSVIDSQY